MREYREMTYENMKFEINNERELNATVQHLESLGYKCNRDTKNLQPVFKSISAYESGLFFLHTTDADFIYGCDLRTISHISHV